MPLTAPELVCLADLARLYAQTQYRDVNVPGYYLPWTVMVTPAGRVSVVAYGGIYHLGTVAAVLDRLFGDSDPDAIEDPSEAAWFDAIEDSATLADLGSDPCIDDRWTDL